MHRIDTDGNVSNLFNEGDPTVPRNPTLVDKHWLNAVQEEIATTIEARGVSLVKGTNQLATALAAVTRVAPTFVSPWDNDGTGYLPPVKYFKDAAGNVQVEGFCAHTSNGDSALIFTLPSGFRPPTEQQFVCGVGTSVCSVYVETNGNVTPKNVTGVAAIGTTLICLSPIRFHV